MVYNSTRGEGAMGDGMRVVPPMPRRRSGDEGEQLVSAAEVAERWGMSRDSIYRIPPNELPSIKLGSRTRRYRLRDVVEYERERTRG